MTRGNKVRTELTDVGIFGAMRVYGDITMNAVIDLRRTFSRDDAERALAATIADFPVLGKRYLPGFWRDRWVDVTGPTSDAVHFEEARDLEAQTDAWLRRPIDATKDRPVRVVGLVHDRGMRMLLSVLHLAADGAGMAALGHVFGAHLYGMQPSLPVDPRRDVWRAIDGLGLRHAPLVALDMAKLLAQQLRHAFAAHRERPYGDGSPRPTWRHIVIDAPRLERLKSRCHGRASVNDILLAVFSRIAGDRSNDGPVVVLYTMDLRRYGAAPRLTATNSSSILSAVVPRRALQGDLETTTAAVAKITGRQRSGMAGPAFMLGPYALGAAVPHGVARALVRVLAPVLVDLPLGRGLIVTNVGRIDHGLAAFGDDVVGLRIVGPNVVGFPMPVVVAFGYRGELHLDMFAAPGLGEGALDELEAELDEALGEPRAR